MMNKWLYGLAIFTFMIFCLLWMTFKTSFIQSVDRNASDFLFGNKVVTLFHYIGETEFIFAISIILLAVIWFRLRDYKLMLFVVLTVGFGYGLYQFLKHLIERPRPDIVNQFSTFSFPSGHATHGLLFMFTIAYCIHQLKVVKRVNQVWIAAIILSLLIGLSRIAEGRHFASDVLAGWMLGFSWFMLCTWWYERS